MLLTRKTHLSGYLDEDSANYFVFEKNGNIIGAEGSNFLPEEDLTRISWDVIHPEAQGKEVGTAIIRFRVVEIRKNSPSKQIQVRTSQYVYRFYEKMGFSILRTEKDFCDPGYDLYDMRMFLS